MKKRSTEQMPAGKARKASRPQASARPADSHELSENEKRFASFMNQLPGFAWMKDLEGRYVYVNSAVQRLEPYRRGWLGKTDAELWPKEIADKYRANDEQVIAQAKPLETLEPYTVNGERHFVVVSKFPIIDNSGAVILVGGAAVDVTARAITEERLSEYEKVVEGLEEMIIVVDRDYRYLLANRAFLDHRNAKREEIVGRFVWQVVGRDVFEQVVKPKLDECLAGNVVRYEWTYNYPGIGPRDLFLSYFPVQGSNGIDRVVCIKRDITEQKTTGIALHEAERKYREIFENAGEGIFQSTPEGRFIDANPAMAAMFGFETPEELIRDCRDISRQIYVDASRREEFKRALARNGVVSAFEIQVLRKDRTRFWTSVNARAVRDIDGRILYYEGTAQDITERRRAEESLRLFRSLIDQSSDAIEVIDPETLRFLDCNESAHQDLGYTREEFLRLTIPDIDPIFDEAMASNIQKDMNRFGFSLFESVHRRKDGSTFPVEIKTKRVRLEQDYRLAIVRDITQRKQAEDALRQSEQQLIDAQRLANIGSWSWDIQSNTLIWSDELCRMFGLEPQTVPMTYEAFLEYVHPDDREEVATKMAASLQTHESFSQNRRIVRADGELRILHARGSVICDEEDQPIRIIGTSQDITEQLRAEEALRAAERKYHDIFENAREGIFQTTPQGRFITANPALALMLDFDSPEELIAARADIAREHYVDPQRREEFKELLNTQGFVTNFELEAFKRDGSKIWISENVRAVRDHDGAVMYFEGTTQDITERKRAELTSAAFATLARRLSGASTNFDAARIIAETARQLFGWDACNLDLYSAESNLVEPLLNVDTIGGRDVDVTPLIAASHPTARGRRVLAQGPELILREHPIKFDSDSVPFGDKSRPAASIMSVPIKHGNEIVGLLSIQSYSHHAYDRNSLLGLVALSEHCGEALNRIRAEESFHESEERYRDLVENSHEFICTHDLNGVILSANRAAAVALGVDLDQLVGKGNIRDVLVPSNRDRFDEYIDRLKTDLATSGLMVVRTSSGEERIWEYYNSIRTEGVAEPIVRGIARDITEQRQAARALRESEERYRELFENSKDAIYVHDLEGQYVSVNRAAEELSGFTREEILGDHFSNFIAPQHLKDVRENFSLKLDAPVETTYEAAIICKDGSRKPVEVSSRVIYKDGVAIGIQGTARDISERKRTQEALQIYSRRLIDAQEAERQNIARELHDQIGQILTAVRLSLQRIEKTCKTDCCFPRIVEGIEVVDEALSRVRELSLELRPSLLDDLGLAAALRWYVARYADRTGIKTSIMGDTEVRRISHEVETACFRIIQEALSNAALHSGATKASIKVETVNGKLLFTVSDNGIGFRPDLLLNGVASAALGLRGMQERALAVRGCVKIQSKPNKGTQIIVSVPAK